MKPTLEPSGNCCVKSETLMFAKVGRLKLTESKKDPSAVEIEDNFFILGLLWLLFFFRRTIISPE